MKITKFTGGMVQTNGYLLESPAGNYLVDAPAGIAEWIAGKGVRVDGLYLTHQHYDHVEDVAALTAAAGVKVFAWAAYSQELTLEAYGSEWIPSVAPYVVDGLIPAGKNEIFGMAVQVGYVPGHSTDSLSFYLADAGVVFAGDALFAGSVGRCDLPGGNFETLLEGIERELLTLPDDTVVYSGHGPETTIGKEKVSNGFLK